MPLENENMSVEDEGFLEGQLLLAMPAMADERFERTVIFVCSHSREGAMGLVINREMTGITFQQLLEQLNIEVDGPIHDIPIRAGGPVETGRGFVLHTSDFIQDSTLVVTEQIALTATVDILKAVARGDGPRRHIMALGYAGWGPGQLEQEIQSNGWLTCRADEEIVFDTRIDQKWPRAMAMLGIDVSMLSSLSGHA